MQEAEARFRGTALDQAGILAREIKAAYGPLASDMVPADLDGAGRYARFGVSLTYAGFCRARIDRGARGDLGWTVSWVGRAMSAGSFPLGWGYADLPRCLRELGSQVELRIPDKYLRARPWEPPERTLRGEPLPEEGAGALASRLAKELAAAFGSVCAPGRVLPSPRSAEPPAFGCELLPFGYLPLRVEARADGLLHALVDFGEGVRTEVPAGRATWAGDHSGFLARLREQLLLRVPDKYLEAGDWDEKPDDLEPEEIPSIPTSKLEMLLAREVQDAFDGEDAFALLLPDPRSPDDPAFGYEFCAYGYVPLRVETLGDGLLHAFVNFGEGVRTEVPAGRATWAGDHEGFLAGLREQLRLRIPDKYLAYLEESERKRRRK